MSPHAMNSAALHPLHFGQSPPTAQMSHMGFAAGMQNPAAAAAAAAAVQLPTLRARRIAELLAHGHGARGDGGGLKATAAKRGDRRVVERRQGFHRRIPPPRPGSASRAPNRQSGRWDGSSAPQARAAAGWLQQEGAQQSTPPRPPSSPRRHESPSSFTPGSLSQTRGFRIHTVEEDGAESDDMDMDGASGSGPNSRRSSGMGARKRSNEAFNDPSEWDPNFSDELLLDGEGGAQHAARARRRRRVAGSSGDEHTGNWRVWGSSASRRPGGLNAVSESSDPKWQPVAMTGRAGFSPQQQVGGWPVQMNVDQQNAAIAANLNAYLQQQQQNVAAAAAMNTFHQGSPQQQMGFFPPEESTRSSKLPSGRSRSSRSSSSSSSRAINLTGRGPAAPRFNGQAQHQPSTSGSTS